ncbi:LptF/LptG family permease [Persephonella sp. IF05-L8]|uniref:LptF/LptG family permease n=1 Tax=Persephonella sp. IF05-L8 TaxID=1158338 RepID=UPI000497A4E3
MKILYRYISWNLIKNFLLLIGFFSIVIVSSQLLHLPSVLYHIGFFKFLQVLFFVNLSFLKYQVFFGFFIASLIVGYSLRENREIYAIYSSGISRGQLISPVLWLSIVFVVVAGVISLFLVPYANRERAQFITVNVKQHILDSISEKNFMKLSERLTIYVDKKNENSMEDIFIYNGNGGLSISAKEATFKGNHIILKNGYIQIPSQEGFNFLKFEKYDFDLSVDYMKKYEFEDLENKKLIEFIKGKDNKQKNRAIAVLTDRVLFTIPFLFIGIIGLLMGIQIEKSRDTLIGIAVIISIIYMTFNTYFIKLIQKGNLHPAIYLIVVIGYFGVILFWLYRKK